MRLVDCKRWEGSTSLILLQEAASSPSAFPLCVEIATCKNIACTVAFLKPHLMEIKLPSPQKKKDVLQLVRAWERHSAAGFAEILSATLVDDAVITEDTFTELLSTAINRHGIAPSEICRKFAVTPSTISRWTHGTSSPQQFVRPIVLDWVRERLLGEADNTEIAEAKQAVSRKFAL